MKTRKLGSEGPEISVVGFGAWEAGGMAWGPNPPDEQTIQAMQVAIEAGANWIDTAEVYGGGRSEELVAKALEGRDDVLIFTKVAPKRAGTGHSRDDIPRAVEKSLERLGRDRIDLYQLHWPTSRVPIEETWEAMAGLVDSGLVSHIGLSNYERKRIDACEKIRHVDSLQPQFSMLHQEGRDGLFSHLREQGTGVLAYGPLAYGLLTGAFTKDTKFGDDDWRGGGHGMRGYDQHFAPGRYEKNIEIVDSLRPVADRLNIKLSQLALAWAAHQDGVTAAIAGSRSPDHVKENCGAGDIDLSDKDLEEIDSILSA
jgi:aryl-alcohol dehydrogenase-like predicted oxidoreductase